MIKAENCRSTRPHCDVGKGHREIQTKKAGRTLNKLLKQGSAANRLNREQKTLLNSKKEIQATVMSVCVLVFFTFRNKKQSWLFYLFVLFF